MKVTWDRTAVHQWTASRARWKWKERRRMGQMAEGVEQEMATGRLRLGNKWGTTAWQGGQGPDRNRRRREKLGRVMVGDEAWFG